MHKMNKNLIPIQVSYRIPNDFKKGGGVRLKRDRDENVSIVVKQGRGSK